MADRVHQLEMTQPSQTAALPRLKSRRHAAVLMGGGAALSVLLMAHHPTILSSTVAGALAQLQHIAFVNRLVHAGLLVVLVAIFVGFLGLADRLGWTRLSVRAAAAFQGCGLVCMIGAALINGFLLSALAGKNIDQPPEVVEALRHLLVSCHLANQTLAQAGTVALSIAILAWSLAMRGAGRAAFALALIGLIVGALPVVLLVGGQLQLDVRGMGGVVVVQALWNIAVAVWLLKQREAAIREVS
jgi:hypothetical protein